MLIEDTIKELKTIMMSLTVKYRHKGEKIDTVETRFNANRYISAVDKTDSFYSHTVYDTDAIMRSGLTQDMTAAIDYATNPETIPDNYRSIVLEEQRKVVIADFVEYNPYYRMLNGQPPLTGDELFASIPFYESFGIEIKPVSMFTESEVLHLEASGELDTLKELYPKAKYLNYLGPYRINPYNARKAHHMQVLRTSYTKNINLLDRFLSIYEENRSYVMSVLYVKDFSNNKPYYDEFMAMMLSVMTTQRVIVDTFKLGISRDFYDVAMIRALYESYNVPYIEELPVEYHNLICKNLNKLLYYKSTDKVIFDLLDLLGFSRGQVYKYYLVKNHKLDIDGNPVFEYKDDGNGNMVEDKERMYDVHFVSVNIDEENEEFELSNSRNRVSYEEVILTDPYWWDEDSAVLQKIYDEEYNFINTKYMHINIMYKMTDMIFEIVHVFKILRDRYPQTDGIELSIPKILNSRKISLFKFFVMMSAALCKLNNLRGEIITDNTQVAGFVGFNFQTDFIALRDYLNANSHLVDSNTITSYISKMDVVRLEDVDTIFGNIKELWKFLSKEMSRTTNYEAFCIYEKLYKTLFVSEAMSDLFTMRDGTIAETYMMMLMDMDPELHSMIDNADEKTLKDYISHGIETIENVYTKSENVHLIIGNTTSLMDALLKLMRFFKSYTVDIRNFNVIYVFDHHYLHGIKMLDRIKRVTSDMTISIPSIHLKDYIKLIGSIEQKDTVKYKDTLRHTGLLDFHNAIVKAEEISIIADIDISEAFKITTRVYINSKINEGLRIEIWDKIKELLSKSNINAYMDVVMSTLTATDIDIIDDVGLMDTLGLTDTTLSQRDILGMKDTLIIVRESEQETY